MFYLGVIAEATVWVPGSSTKPLRDRIVAGMFLPYFVCGCIMWFSRQQFIKGGPWHPGPIIDACARHRAA